MSPRLVDDLPRPSGVPGLRIWLKSSGYARRLLCGEAGDPWESAPRYLSFFTQAHGLLRSDVGVVDVGDLYRSWLARHPALTAEMAAKPRAAFPLKRMLEEDGPRRLLTEVVEAVAASLRGQTPLVLAMPAPRRWLAEAAGFAGRVSIDIDTDTVESAAMYMADLARVVSALPIGGLLLEEDDAAEDGDIEAVRPLANIARHYRWGLALRGRAGPGAHELDTLISTAPLEGGDLALGLDVSRDLWSGAPLATLGAGQFYFAEIPEGAEPEFVLQQLSRLRA
ncbi:hypothetical protein EZH22_00285 [Xanthobacter dioxanivorans]|uniref:Uncharacterized protein n=1 Tax=Xanthobacter dioxanivorans TaxID=2528964 RepID=A0A974SJZ1_9HYPH|nr:hypothetical protein [Xanthobacter dioxanivorans]QRG06938.1 hypothetical protein EZH22_00285 [Xanthobacter dioxanivorans]